MRFDSSSRQDKFSVLNFHTGSVLVLGAGLAASLGASAALVESSLTITDINITVDNGYKEIDLNGDGQVDLAWYASESYGGIKTAGGLEVLVANGYLRSLSEGDQVGSGSEGEWGTTGYAYTPSNPPGPWASEGAHGYVGLRFMGDDSFNYGWLELTRGSLTVGQFGYQSTSGVAAAIPSVAQPPQVVPEPGSLLLVATGAAGMLALRRRRQAGAQAAVH